MYVFPTPTETTWPKWIGLPAGSFTDILRGEGDSQTASTLLPHVELSTLSSPHCFTGKLYRRVLGKKLYSGLGQTVCVLFANVWLIDVPARIMAGQPGVSLRPPEMVDFYLELRPQS